MALAAGTDRQSPPAAAAGAPARGCAPAPVPARSAAVPGATTCMRALLCGCSTCLIAALLGSVHPARHRHSMSVILCYPDFGYELAFSAAPVTACSPAPAHFSTSLFGCSSTAASTILIRFLLLLPRTWCSMCLSPFCSQSHHGVTPCGSRHSCAVFWRSAGDRLPCGSASA